MPIYEYECANGHRLEVIQRLDAPAPERCATCGAPLHKMLARPAIVFKGTGWAKKDARAGAASKAGPEPTKAEDGARTSSTGEADGKAAGEAKAGVEGKPPGGEPAAGGGASGADRTSPAGEPKAVKHADGGSH